MNIVLIHGSYFGPWCWELVQPRLEARGHRVTAVDLPSSDPAAGAADYARAVVDQVNWAEPTVLVAHSMSGLVIPLVATLRPVVRMVFLNALLPRVGSSVMDQRLLERIDAPVRPATAEWTDLGHGVWAVGSNTAREMFFPEADAAVATWATERLRPQAYRVMTEISPLSSWPETPSAAIVSRQDRTFDPDWLRRSARERLSFEPIEMDADHAPMLSQPERLADLLGVLASEASGI